MGDGYAIAASYEGGGALRNSLSLAVNSSGGLLAECSAEACWGCAE